MKLVVRVENRVATRADPEAEVSSFTGAKLFALLDDFDPVAAVRYCVNEKVSSSDDTSSTRMTSTSRSLDRAKTLHKVDE